MNKNTKFIGTEDCLVVYDFNGDAGKERIKFDIYIDEDIVLLKHPVFSNLNIAVIDSKFITYTLYRKYNKKYRVSETSNIELRNSTARHPSSNKKLTTLGQVSDLTTVSAGLISLHHYN